MYNFSCYFIPTDQTKRPHYETCIIYCSDDESLLVNPKDLDSWESLLKAATIRNHRTLLDVAENAKEGEILPVNYHRKCRSLFTMKGELEKISQPAAAAAEEIPESNVESGEQRRRWQEPSTSRTYPEICISCEKKTRYKKGTRPRDPLIQCVDLRGDASIRKAAIAMCDSRITGFASRDLVAAEAWYHGQCYRDYTRPDKASKHSDSPSDENNCCKIESQVYDKLFEFIRSDLLENPRLVKMVDLRKKLMSYMR